MTELLETVWYSVGDVSLTSVITNTLAAIIAAVIATFITSAFVLRRGLMELIRMETGHSEKIFFQAHYIVTDEDGTETLVVRDACPPQRREVIFPNAAVRRYLKLLELTPNIRDPVLSTEGTKGELVQQAVFHEAAGRTFISSADEDVWLAVLTRDDHRFTGTVSTRYILVKEEDLSKLVNHERMQAITVEHREIWDRLVMLRQIALHRSEYYSHIWEIDARIPTVTAPRNRVALDWSSVTADLQRHGVSVSGVTD